MASIANDKGGRRRIQFVAFDGTKARKAIRLGKVSREHAEAVCRHVDAIISARISGESVPRQTAEWLSGISEGLRDRLENVGLLEARKKTTVAEYLTTWIAGKQASGNSPNSLRAWGQTIRELTDLFGDRRLITLEQRDAERYRANMQGRGLRPTTIHKRLAHGRQMMEDAKDEGLAINPFEKVQQDQGDPSERRTYITVADTQQVLEQCPSVHWRLLVALSRFGGLRIPSESAPLTWEAVDWDRGRLTITSPKTRRKGKGYRIIPLFPLLRPHLEAAWDAAEPGDTFIFPENLRDGDSNLRTQLARITRRAGVGPWARIFHNMRSSCESDLAASFPLATVVKWMGNTPSVALRHYVDVTDPAFLTAATWVPGDKSGAESGARDGQNAAQRVGASKRVEKKETDVNCSETGASGGSMRVGAALRVDGEDGEAGVYGNRTHLELCSNPTPVLKTRANTSCANTPERFRIPQVAIFKALVVVVATVLELETLPCYRIHYRFQAI